MKTFSTFGPIGTALLAFTTVTAEAAEPRLSPQPRTATVYAADLNLARLDDARALYERIGYAARTICTADELSFDAKRQRHWRECVEAAVAAAVERADAPLVTAIHLQQRSQLARL